MIFLGDFVFPFSNGIQIFNFDKKFEKEEKILNLEGLILNPNDYLIKTSGIALYSSEKSYDILKQLNVKAVGIANNHITDYDYDIELQKKVLNKNGIQSCGAGSTLDSSIEPALIEDRQFKYAVFSFGWNVIGCKNSNNNHPGVAPLDEKLITKVLSIAKVTYPDRKIILYLHWNYEFEYYPQPGDRKLAFAAIDAGADAIIGHHPHITGVYEIFKNKPIFYSLGNFFIPEYNFGGFNLVYGDSAKIGLGIKFSDNIDEITLYWIENDNNFTSIKMTELLCQSEKIENFTSHFQNDLNAYAKWFGKNRKKKKLLPIYKEHSNSFKNNLLLQFLNIRNYIVHKITAFGLRARNN